LLATSTGIRLRATKPRQNLNQEEGGQDGKGCQKD